MLGRRRQPHPVHDGRFQPGQQCGGTVGVNRVVVTGDHRERTACRRRGEGGVTTAATRGVGGVVGHRSPRPHRIGQLSLAGAAADRESLLQGPQRLYPSASLTATETGTTRPTSVS